MPTLTQRPPEKGHINQEIRVIALPHQEAVRDFVPPRGWKKIDRRLVDSELVIHHHEEESSVEPDALLVWLEYRGDTYAETLHTIDDSDNSGDLSDDSA